MVFDDRRNPGWINFVVATRRKKSEENEDLQSQVNKISQEMLSKNEDVDVGVGVEDVADVEVFLVFWMQMRMRVVLRISVDTSRVWVICEVQRSVFVCS